MGPIPQGCYPSSRSTFLLSRLTSPGLIPGPTNSFPDTSATASASSPSFTGTLLRTNSMALSLSDSYARKFRTIRGFPSESKVVTRMFHPAGILGNMRPYCRRSMACLIQTDPPKVWSALHHGVSFSRIEKESQGRVRVCRHVNDIHRCLENGVLAPVLHIEGCGATSFPAATRLRSPRLPAWRSGSPRVYPSHPRT